MNVVQCLQGRVKWFHKVSSSYSSFVLRPWARKQVSLMGIFSSDLLYILLCVSERQYFCLIVTDTCEVSWNRSVTVYSNAALASAVTFSTYSRAALMEIQLRWKGNWTKGEEFDTKSELKSAVLHREHIYIKGEKKNHHVLPISDS